MYNAHFTFLKLLRQLTFTMDIFQLINHYLSLVKTILTICWLVFLFLGSNRVSDHRLWYQGICRIKIFLNFLNQVFLKPYLLWCYSDRRSYQSNGDDFFLKMIPVKFFSNFQNLHVSKEKLLLDNFSLFTCYVAVWKRGKN